MLCLFAFTNFLMHTIATTPLHQPALALPQDTTHTTVAGKPSWGPSGDAIEELRVTSSKTLLLAEPTRLAALADGGVVVLELKGAAGPTLEFFNSTGHLVSTTGRRGAGPGEFSDRVELASSLDGTVFVWDVANARVTRFDKNGKLLSQASGLQAYPGSNVVQPGARNTFYLKSRIGKSLSTGVPPLGYVHYSAEGRALDTVPPVASRLKSPGLGTGQDPTEFVAILSTGQLVTAASDRLGFLLQPVNRSTQVHAVERPTDRAKFTQRERDDWNALFDKMSKGRGGESAPKLSLPESKPSFNALLVDPEDRIWLNRVTEAVRDEQASGGQTPEANAMLRWRTPWVLDAFRSDGTFLGEVRLPLDVRTFVARGNSIWALRMINDEPVLVKFRIR